MEQKRFWERRRFDYINNHLDFIFYDLDTFEKLSLLADIKEEEYGKSLTNIYEVKGFNSYTFQEFTFSVSEQRSKSFISDDTILFIVFGIIKYDNSIPRINYILLCIDIIWMYKRNHHLKENKIPTMIPWNQR